MWVVPVTIVPPFDKAVRYPAAIAAAPALELDDYMSWMLPCSAISILDLPALSLPVGLELQVKNYKLRVTSYKLPAPRSHRRRRRAGSS